MALLAVLRIALARTVPPGIGDGIDEDHAAAKQPLDLPRQPVGVDEGQQVMSDESALKTRFTGEMAKLILDRCQRTGPAGELDQRSPDYRRQVKQHQLREATEQEAAEYDEQDEAQVQQQYPIGQLRVDHDVQSISETKSIGVICFSTRWGQ